MPQHQPPASVTPKALQHPFFRSLQDEIDRALDRFNLGSLMGNGSSTAGLAPAINIAETDTAIEITAEIPGVKESDLDVSISGQTLVLKGEKSNETETTEKDYHLVERQYGSFRRHIPLGFAPKEGAVDAVFTNGVLSLTIKKPADAVSSVQKVKIATK